MVDIHGPTRYLFLYGTPRTSERGQFLLFRQSTSRKNQLYCDITYFDRHPFDNHHGSVFTHIQGFEKTETLLEGICIFIHEKTAKREY